MAEAARALNRAFTLKGVGGADRVPAQFRRKKFGPEQISLCFGAFVVHLILMSWVWLIIAGLLEICWAVGLKYSDGFAKLWPSVFTVGLMLASFWCLAQAVKGLPLGTSYAIWTGIGAVGTAIAGIILFKEPATAARLACMVLIVAGIVGLKFSTAG